MRFTTRQDLLLAVAAFAGGVVLLLARGYGTWPAIDIAPGWRLLPLAGLCVAMVFRRTRPIVGLLLSTPFNFTDVVIGPSIATLMIYSDALYAASLYGPRRAAEWLLGITTAATLAVAAAFGIALTTISSGVIAGSLAGVAWVGPVLTAMVVREHRDRADAERQRAAQMARLAEMDRRAAVNTERARMARELHDVIANHLSAVALHSSAVLKVSDLDRESINRSMEVIRENSVQGLAEMRRMIGLLREGDGEADPAAAPKLDGLERLVAHTARSDLTAGLKVLGDAPGLPAPVEHAAYRIVQESLTNALKHAAAGRVEVLLEYRPGCVVVTVDSPLGAGGSRLPGSGSGLIGMRERVTMLDGTFEAGPGDGRWRVYAELPLTDRERP
ncbi:sensor histidine kinase [Actinomadura rudentiformis]|uniref:histidine kinase n=1 Tax=Actinomadura rudentiformis TaxID=359158 RepID=A0A6H9Z2C3_9ACTN|nr:histidine kinase [Actinomadura rudentiformis]KAB2348869.1 sensor histidine kinase [Actinomadura rudentiformis]